MKKILLLASLITALSSCGGGGGGGGSSQTGSATPVPTPSQPGGNTNNQAQNPNLPNNNGQITLPNRNLITITLLQAKFLKTRILLEEALV